MVEMIAISFSLQATDSIYKNKDFFPNSAKDIISFLKDSPFVETNLYRLSKPVNYYFGFKRVPDQTVSELFGHNLDAKWSNILYVGQVAEKDILLLEKNSKLMKKVRKTIDNSNKMLFKNELFTITKVK